MNEEPLGVFLAYYDNYLRRNRITDKEFADYIREPESTIYAVRAGKLPAPVKMCDAIGWERVLVSVPRMVFEDEYRYINKRGYSDDDI